MPARVVLASWGSYGDLFPSISLAIRLRTAGHTPVVASCPYYRDLVESEGLEFRPVGPDVDPSDTALMARAMDGAKGSEVVVNEMLAPRIGESYADLWRATRDADLLVTHPVTFAGPLVAEKRGLPWLSSVLAPASFFSIHDFPALPPVPRLMQLLTSTPWSAAVVYALARRATASWTRPVQALREELGLPRAESPLYRGQFSPHGTLALFSRALARPQPDWPPNTVVTGFPFYNRPVPLPESVERFLQAGEPPIVFTLGSSGVGVPGSFFDESVLAVERLGCRAILIIRQEIGSGIERPVPPDVLIVDYVPHEAIFPHASIIVHHGGVGTTGQALRSGKPMLVVPHAHDQYDNAARVRAAGIGRVLEARRYRGKAVESQLRALLGSQEAREHAARAADVIRSEGGADAACDVITALLARQRLGTDR